MQSVRTHPDQRKPGQYGREVGLRIAIRLAVAVVVLGVLPLFLWSVVGLPAYVATFVSLVTIPTMLITDRRVERNLDRRLQGVTGEERVGAILAQMSSTGWRVLHDCVLSRGNIDHVAIGPGGLYTVETKSRRGRVDVDRIDERWLKQAYAQRKIVEETVGVTTTCLLVFSDAYLIGRPVAFRRGVVVLPARMLMGHLERKSRVYTPERVEAIFEDLSTAVERRSRR